MVSAAPPSPAAPLTRPLGQRVRQHCSEAKTQWRLGGFQQRPVTASAPWSMIKIKLAASLVANCPGSEILSNEQLHSHQLFIISKSECAEPVMTTCLIHHPQQVLPLQQASCHVPATPSAAPAPAATEVAPARPCWPLHPASPLRRMRLAADSHWAGLLAGLCVAQQGPPLQAQSWRR